MYIQQTIKTLPQFLTPLDISLNIHLNITYKIEKFKE